MRRERAQRGGQLDDAVLDARDRAGEIPMDAVRNQKTGVSTYTPTISAWTVVANVIMNLDEMLMKR